MDYMQYLKNLVPQKIKNIYHLAQAILANFWYGFPSKNIKVIGVTGTNGKTTTCQMITKILEEAGKRVAMISTINFKLGDKEWVNDTKYTTLSSFKVQKFIKQAVETGCEYIIIETSSHSLDQNRVWGINFEVAVITNVTREHLDYHQTMDKYRQAKALLFKKAEISVVNLDMERPEEFLNLDAKRKYSYTVKLAGRDMRDGDSEIIKAEDVNIIEKGSTFNIQGISFAINLPGIFNIENALAAVCVGLSQNINLETISGALQKITSVPGRFEYVANDKGFNIIIDYAVTPDSLSKLYGLISQIKEVRPLSTKTTQRGRTSIISVFGACGERDRGKRPIMGEIVSKYADFIILTNEDPYNEDPQRIINEIASGVTNKRENENFWKIFDRREAIKKALQLAKPGDFIVVTGKGAEEIMAVGNKRIPWNDKRVIRELLQGLK